MPIDNGNLALKGLDDLFSTEENRQEEQREQVQQIPIDALHPFTNKYSRFLGFVNRPGKKSRKIMDCDSGNT